MTSCLGNPNAWELCNIDNGFMTIERSLGIEIVASVCLKPQ